MNALVPTEIDVLTLPSLPFERRNDLPNIAAIYFVLSGKGDMLYIGRTKKLCFRFLSHHRLSDFKQTAQVRIAYLTVTDATLLPSIEKAMIAYFDPPLNCLRTARGSVEYVQTAFRLPLDVLQALRKGAKAADRPLNRQVICMLRKALELPEPEGRRVRMRLLSLDSNIEFLETADTIQHATTCPWHPDHRAPALAGEEEE